jgi:hypothetical protein
LQKTLPVFVQHSSRRLKGEYEELSMKKLFGIKLLAIALILVALTTDGAAQTRIRFARDADSATVKGTLAPGASRKYAVRVGEGQAITIEVSSNNEHVQIDAADVHGSIDGGGESLEYISDVTGDQWITVINQGETPTRYKLTVSASW